MLTPSVATAKPTTYKDALMTSPPGTFQGALGVNGARANVACIIYGDISGNFAGTAKSTCLYGDVVNEKSIASDRPDSTFRGASSSRSRKARRRY
jgi:hypothetical protein